MDTPGNNNAPKEPEDSEDQLPKPEEIEELSLDQEQTEDPIEDETINGDEAELSNKDDTLDGASDSTTAVEEPAVAEQSLEPRKRKLPGPKTVTAIVVLILLLIGGIVFFLGSDDEADQSANSTDSSQDQSVVNLASAVSVVEGTVQISTDSGGTWVDATGGETVAVSHRVRTLADSRAVLLHDDGSAIRLDASTEIQLSVSDSQTTVVKLISGQVYSRVVESETRTYSVATDRERFEALGTAFKTNTAEASDSVEVYQSSIKVETDSKLVDEGNKYSTDTKEVTDVDLEKLKDDEFVQWNKDQDSKNDKFKNKLGVLEEKVEEPVEEPAQTQPEPAPSTTGITLSGTATENGVKLNWELSGVTSTDGFKIVRDKTDTTPTYKENTATYIGDGSVRSKNIDVHDGHSYYFRVCIYRAEAGTCDTYSNTVEIKAPEKSVEKVVPGAVVLSIDGNKISWSISGTAPHGYKVVMNTAGAPSYPANSIKFVGADTKVVDLPDKPEGTYKVRVCKYTADAKIDGGCTDYSNEVTYVVSSGGI